MTSLRLRDVSLGRLLAELARRAAAAPILSFAAALAAYEARTPRRLQMLGALCGAASILVTAVALQSGALAAAAGPLGTSGLLRAASRPRLA